MIRSCVSIGDEADDEWICDWEVGGGDGRQS